MNIKDISTQPVTISKSDTISNALRIMEKQDTRRLLVFNKDELSGVITMRSIARKLGTWKTYNLPASALHVAAAATDLYTKVLPDTNIKDAISLMYSTGKILVVTDNHDIQGWITPHEILKNTKSIDGFAAEVMEKPITVSPGDRVVHARRIILDKDIGRLPVIENSELVGIITERDIANALMNFRDIVSGNQQNERIRNLLVSDIMTQNVVSVRTNTLLQEVISIIISKNIGGVPVLNMKDEIVGIISRRAIIKHLAVKE